MNSNNEMYSMNLLRAVQGAYGERDMEENQAIADCLEEVA